MKKYAQKILVFCSGSIGGSRMVVPFPKIGIIKNSVRNDHVTAFFITVSFITEKKPRNAQFYVLITWVDPE